MYEALVAELGRTRAEGASALESGTLVAGPAVLVNKPSNRDAGDVVMMPGVTTYSDGTRAYEGLPDGALASSRVVSGINSWSNRHPPVSGSFFDEFSRGFDGGHLGVMEGSDPSFGVTAGDAARAFWNGTKSLLSDLSGAGSANNMASNWRQGNYGQSVLYGLKSLGEAGATVLGFGAARSTVSSTSSCVIKRSVLEAEFGSVRTGLKIPQGISPRQFDRISSRIRSVAGQIGLGDDIFVMGSRSGDTARAGSDLYIGIRVSQEHFDLLIEKSFANAKNSQSLTMEFAIRDGRIQAGEAGLRNLSRSVAKDLGFSADKVQLSIIRDSGFFDNGAQSPLSYTFR